MKMQFSKFAIYRGKPSTVASLGAGLGHRDVLSKEALTRKKMVYVCTIAQLSSLVVHFVKLNVPFS